MNLIERLWATPAVHPGRVWRGDSTGAIELARRYLDHAITRGTPLASAVRLSMSGEIRLKRWVPFTADEVIHWDRGMIWTARVRVNGLPVTGYDRIVDDDGAMRWRFLGLIPFLSASGPDVTRSAAERMAGESVWLPSVLTRGDTNWEAPGESLLRARVTAQGHATTLEMGIDDRGALTHVSMRRWGNPGGGGFGERVFGGFVEAERTFAGYTIPSRLRMGWDFGVGGFGPDGEFFRVTIDRAEYR